MLALAMRAFVFVASGVIHALLNKLYHLLLRWSAPHFNQTEIYHQTRLLKMENIKPALYLPLVTEGGMGSCSS